MRFLATDGSGEKAFRLCHEEIPYATAVEIEQWDESELRPDGVDESSYMVIMVENSQPEGILTEKRRHVERNWHRCSQDLEELVGVKVNLQLHVAVHKGWTENQNFLREQGIE